MSIVINRSILSKEEKDRLFQMLTLQPKTEFQPGRSNQQIEEKEPLYFFRVEAEKLYIPFYFGLIYSKGAPNDKIQRVRMPFLFTGTLLHHQEEVVEKALVQLKEKRTAILATYPGSGKTVMGAYLSQKVWEITEACQVVLVIHPLVVLNASWRNTYLEFTNARVWVVGEEPLPKEVPNVIISLDQRVSKIPSILLAHVGFLILDEAHMLCTRSRIPTLLATMPTYVLIETATPQRADGMHIMINALAGPDIITLNNVRSFQVLKLLTGIQPEIKTTTRGVDWNHLINSLCLNEKRNQLVLGAVLDGIKKDWKIIILTPRKNHVELLHQLLLTQGIKSEYMMGTKKNYNDSQVLIGTVSKIGTGFDEKMACPDFGGRRADLLIYLSSTKKVGLMEQNVGRIFRASNPAVIHFVDDHASIKRHWYEAQKWYRSRGATISELKVT